MNGRQPWKTEKHCNSKKELKEKMDRKHKSLEDPRVTVCSNRITEGSRSACATE